MVVGAALMFGAGFAFRTWWSPASTNAAPARRTDAASAAATPSTPVMSPALSSNAPGSNLSAREGGTPREVLGHLVGLKVNAQDPRSARSLLLAFERLREAGLAALPAIRDVLASGEDADYDPAAGQRFRNGIVPLDFVVPPSLRLGLLEVLKNIGGPEAEAMLLQELKTTGRGVEAAYLGAVLQQASPEKYREAALAAARDLLAMPLTTRTPNPLDRSDRDYLYGMLAAAGDKSQVATAQGQLLLPNGQVDQGALRYLRQMLGEGVIAIAARAWQDPQVDASQREPLARVALNYVGINPAAEQLYRQAIDDPAMSANARKNLIEDLNEAGFADPKHLTPADLPLIDKRLALIDQLAPRAKDRHNAAAFVEAKKDLLNMRDAVLAATGKK